ncbi:uncharacterized protein LOC123293552 [Chrysoperla carnea]|uniref:uncharacterized protein LOC123293552 n=1 Tax=Chrysoperla carnea TaxID=189513 RepID=UPI001D090851|nr:uncharacterized protein LOC123293552 [Chrysoperla carnea]
MQSSELKLDLNDGDQHERKLERQIAEFKADPERMKSANEFVNELLEKAQKEALLKGNKMQSMDSNIGDGKPNLRQWPNRARGFMSRVFQAICNCTKTTGPFPFPTKSS